MDTILLSVSSISNFASCLPAKVGIDHINQIMVWRRKQERFIETVEALPELYTKFDAGQWAVLVDCMTVHAKDRITFTLTCGMGIES